jgi:putative spermidine/putrescine transport system permease protein
MIVVGAAGLLAGIIVPSRDMLVRNASPPDAVGRVFGIVTTGFNFGGMIAPIVGGLLLDHHAPAWIFFGSAAFMLLTVVMSVLAGLAFRKRLPGGDALFFISIASLIMPSIIVSLGIGLQFRLLDTGIKSVMEAWGMADGLEAYGTALGLYTSALGAHLTWTLPVGLLIMFAVFNRFNPAYEEAARDLGATPWQSFRHVVLPLIGPAVVGVGMFGFTLSWDEISRTSQAIGDVNTLPLELQGLTTTVTTPAIYALGTLTTVVSFAVMGLALGLRSWLARRAKSQG